MAKGEQYLIERRVKALADALVSRRDLIVNALAPKGERPPFTNQLSKNDALSFWRQHRNDATGQQILAKMDQASIIELDQALAQQQATQWPPQ